METLKRGAGRRPAQYFVFSLKLFPKGSLSRLSKNLFNFKLPDEQESLESLEAKRRGVLFFVPEKLVVRCSHRYNGMQPIKLT